MVAHALFDHQGTKTIVSAEEYAEVVQKLCITDLPIYHVISYTASMYMLDLSIRLAFTLARRVLYAEACLCTKKTTVSLSSFPPFHMFVAGNQLI